MNEREQLKKWIESREEHTCTCVYCKEEFVSPFKDFTICVDCDNEYAEYIDSKGWVVGEFDCFDHPDYVPDAFKGTKFDI